MGASASSVDRSENTQGALGCNDCNRKFNLFTRRKRVCSECRYLVCHQCFLPEENITLSNRSQSMTSLSKAASITGSCRSCVVLLSIDPKYEDLTSLKVRAIKDFLRRRDIPDVDSCREKRHLIELYLEHYGGTTYLQTVAERQYQNEELYSRHRVHPQGSESFVSGPAANTHSVPSDQGHTVRIDVNERNTANDLQAKPENENISKVSLSEIESLDEVDQLNAKQLKIILASNFVDYRGCKERHELISKVKMLWQSHQANKQLYEKLVNPAAGTNSIPGCLEEQELCKICMDAAIDCVLLECGHMVTCTKCGKQMNECPICRQYVIRAVHIFRT